MDPLRVIWEASDRLCSKRLQPFIPEMISVLREHGEQNVDRDTEAQLSRMSASTIDRLLSPWRKFGGRRGLSTTRPGSLLKNAIPIRTFADWQENKPGFVEVDLVAHCGESTEGFYLNTLCAVDVSSGCLECLPVRRAPAATTATNAFMSDRIIVRIRYSPLLLLPEARQPFKR